MVVAIVNQPQSCLTMLKSASELAGALGKKFSVLVDTDDPHFDVQDCGCSIDQVFYNRDQTGLVSFCETREVSFLFIQMSNDKGRPIRNLLSQCRGLRIPYCFFKDRFSPMQLNKVWVPVSFLEEELEKAQFASAFGRFCGSTVHVLLANDYGSKAATNAARMKTLFSKFDFEVTEEKATKDSFKVELEAALRAGTEGAGMILVSASREYGLDDIVFGPKELKVIQKSTVPVLLVNPRADLYALCD